MAVTWTEEQKKVIELRGRNILVAAAAGSGKTAVLVERILSRLTDRSDPVNVDELLIVTFTRAAAAQMRDRIGQALKARLEKTPENVHLQRQLTLLHYAQITTIDSFCSHVLRSHFDELDLDPDFRIGDEGELRLIRGDLIEQLMEDHYGAGDADYEELVETMAVGKADGGIADLIETLFFFVSAHPFPEKTLRRWGGVLEAGGEEEDPEEEKPENQSAKQKGGGLDKQDWMNYLLEQMHREAGERIEQYEQAIRLCMSPYGPSAYVPMFESDREQAERVFRAGSFDALRRALEEMNFIRKPVIRDKSVDAEKKERLSAFRDECKKAMQKWQELFDFPDEEETRRQWEQSERPLRTLCRLTQEFMERFASYKKERRLLDFNDLEHLALQILTEEKEGRVVPSAVARRLQNSYREVMIDEYQDSNLVQELLLSSVAGHWVGRPNQFMVGDVKQSIYKFRMARPEIFMEKYASYTREDSENQKVDLHKNFRSRPEVLDAANFIFSRIMAKALGGITYDEQNALHAGAVFAEPEEEEKPGAYRTKLLLVDLADDEGYRKEIDAKEAEAKAIAGQIRDLTDEKDGLKIWDSTEGRYRTAGFGDIVILLRTFTGWAEVFVNVLLNAGIPAFAQSSTGYFTTLEVQTVLNCLRILDNPMQDIPLAAVMHSPVGGFSSEEMAALKAGFVKAGSPGSVSGLYGACLYGSGRCSENQEEAVSVADTPLRRKTEAFLAQLDRLRRQAVYLSLHELLQHLYEDTGYYELASVMPDGAVRRANLDMLMEKAVAYEGTSYYGLFDFVRYIENLQKYDVDFGEAAPDGESGNTVRITTIHKSKGLEYPVVFVAGTGKTFNRQDSRARILMHPDLGLAADYVDMENRLRTPTLKKQVLARRLNLDNLGEELRVLYVAMTRAKEKLFLTGTDKHLRKKLAKSAARAGGDGPLPSFLVAESASFLDWLLLSLGGVENPPIDSEVISFTELLPAEVENQFLRLHAREALEQWDWEQVYDEEARRDIKERLAFTYQYLADETLPVKLSVSELKHAALEEEPESCRLIEPEPEEALLPRFLTKEQAVRGASRGTAYHKVMERVDFRELSVWGGKRDFDSLSALFDAWCSQGILTKEEAAAVNRSQILSFASSPVTARMAKAQAAGRLYREKPFVMGVPAGEVYPGCESEELVLVQGIIDVYWQEEDGLYILDYKTDRVGKEDGEQVLVRRYRAQLSYYADALSRAMGLPVREVYLYSFTLNRLITGFVI